MPELQTSSAARWDPAVIEFTVGGNVPKVYEVQDLGMLVDAALSRWSYASCGTLTMRFAGVSTTPAVHGDGRNTISFIYSDWESLALPDAAGVTDVIYEQTTDGWRIVEADIYLNAQNFSWGSGATDPNQRDLFPVLLHEAGHALGLLHSCEVSGEDAAPVCSSAPQYQGTVMFPGYDRSHRELTDDDGAGLCSLYGCTQSCSVCTGPECQPRCDTEASCLDPVCAKQPQCAGRRPLGDPCTENKDCESGACASGGYCAKRCGSEACAHEAASPLGASCQYGSECLGGECLAGAGQASLCTRSCSTSHDDCPSGWTCSAVESGTVCAPLTASGQGCSFPARSTDHRGSVVMTSVLLLLCRRRFRRFIAGKRQ